LDLADKHTPHGWRAAFSTLSRDEGFARDAVELALDHVHDSDVVRAYDRGERFQQRISLMKWWSTKLYEAQSFCTPPFNKGGQCAATPQR
jgi:integrase